MQYNGQDDHPHISSDPFTPHPQQHHPLTSQNDIHPIPIDIDDNSVGSTAASTVRMPTFEELQALAAAQSQQLERANEIVQQQQQFRVQH